MSPTSASIDALPVGAHLVSPRWGYVHHGIHTGKGRVIHYAGFNRPFVRGPVEEVPLEHFARGRSVQVKPWPAVRFAGEAAVQRARSRLGERRYRLWSNNCEHFASWCVSGSPRSDQVDAWSNRMRALIAALARPLAGRRRVRHLAA